MGDLDARSRFDGQMKPLTMPQHYALHTSGEFTPLAISPYQRFALLPLRGNFVYPTLLSPACVAAAPNRQPSAFTLGSLVDGKSNLLSPPDHQAFAGANDPAGSGSNPVTLQFGSFQPGCGMPVFTNL